MVARIGEVRDMAKVVVRELAESQGYNITTLAAKAEVSYPTMHALWHGRSLRVDLSTLSAVARALGVKIGDLIVDEPEHDAVDVNAKQRTPVLAGAY